VLSSMLGLSQERIEQLAAAGVLHANPAT
jgi:hypothetical protein